jgi:hypothetical protein
MGYALAGLYFVTTSNNNSPLVTASIGWCFVSSGFQTVPVPQPKQLWSNQLSTSLSPNRLSIRHPKRWSLHKLNWTPVQSQCYITTDGLSTSLSLCQGPIWGPRWNFYYPEMLRVCWCETPSLTRGRVCSFRLLLGLASAVFLGSESRGRHDYIPVVSNLSLPQSGGPSSCIYFLQEQGSPVILTGIGLKLELIYDWGQSASMSRCRVAHLGNMTRLLLLSDICGLHVVGRPLWREDGRVIYSYNSMSLSGPSSAELMTTSYCLIWDYWVPFFSPLTTRRGTVEVL